MAEDAIPQMREQIEALEKQLKAEQRAREEAVNTARKMTAREVAREAGLDPTHGELFANANPSVDVTVETLNSFADQFKLRSQPAPVEEAAAPNTDDSALSSFEGGGSRPGAPGQPTGGPEQMTREAWNELNRKDPGAARVALSQGRVQLRADNPWVNA
jgi:hypothetical protein